MRTFEQNTEDDNNRFLGEITAFLVKYKASLYEKLESKGFSSIEKVLPLFHVLVHMFTYFRFSDREKLKSLA